LLAIATGKMLRNKKLYSSAGTAPEKVSVLSFTINGMHPYDGGDDVGRKWNRCKNRTSLHSTPDEKIRLEGTVRASFCCFTIPNRKRFYGRHGARSQE